MSTILRFWRINDDEPVSEASLPIKVKRDKSRKPLYHQPFRVNDDIGHWEIRHHKIAQEKLLDERCFSASRRAKDMCVLEADVLRDGLRLQFFLEGFDG